MESSIHKINVYLLYLLHYLQLEVGTFVNFTKLNNDSIVSV